MNEGGKQVKIVIGQLLVISMINDIDNKPTKCEPYYL